METIQKLIDVLTSQYNLYLELHQLLEKEKEYITQWNIDKTMEISKIKDTLLYKEKLLDEAREKIIKKINEYYSEELSLDDLIKKIDDKKQVSELTKLRHSILEITSLIHNENLSIKILYKSNMKMISDVFERLGITEKTSYQSQGKMDTKQGSSFVRSA
jgi:hypothetical protein